MDLHDDPRAGEPGIRCFKATFSPLTEYFSCHESACYLDQRINELMFGAKHGLDVDEPVDEDIDYLVYLASLPLSIRFSSGCLSSRVCSTSVTGLGPMIKVATRTR